MTREGEPRIRRVPVFRLETVGPLRARVARGGLVALTGQAAKLLVTLATLAVLARVLGPGDYGLLALVAALGGFLIAGRDLGLGTVTVQRPEMSRTDASELFWLGFAAAVVLSAFALAISRPLASLFDEPRLTWALPVYACGLVLGALGAQHLALLSRSLRFTAVTAIEVLALALACAVSLVLAFRGAGYWALIVTQPVAAALQTLLAWGCVAWAPSGRPTLRIPNGALRFGGALSFAQLMNQVSRTADNIIVGRFLGIPQLGVYSRAYSLLAAPLGQINAPLAGVVIPTLSRLGEGDEARYRRAAVSVLEKLALLTMPLVAIAIICSEWLVAVLLGPKWGEAATVFQVLGIAAVVESVVSATGWLLVSQGRAREMVVVASATAGALVLAFSIGVRWGIVGVAVGYAVCGVLRLPAVYWYVGRRGPVGFVDLVGSLRLGALAAAGATLGALVARAAISGRGLSVEFPVTVAAGVCVGGMALACSPSGLRELRALAGRLRGPMRGMRQAIVRS